MSDAIPPTLELMVIGGKAGLDAGGFIGPK